MKLRLDGETIMNAGWRKIMSKERELTNDELDAVSGGSNPIVKSTRDASSADLQPFVIVKLSDAATR